MRLAIRPARHLVVHINHNAQRGDDGRQVPPTQDVLNCPRGHYNPESSSTTNSVDGNEGKILDESDTVLIRGVLGISTIFKPSFT